MNTLAQLAHRLAPLLAYASAATMMFAQSITQQAGRIQVPHVATAPRISDYLEGRERYDELRVSGFRQRDPHDGQPATSSTTVYLSYDDNSIYAVFVCASPADKPRAHLSRRDDLTGDETVSLMLDTLHDGRHAYEFTVNPLGVQMDGLITEGQEEDFSFDTQWRSEGRLTADGFIVWMEIPFKSLRFKPGHRDPWGIALARYIPASNESSTWPLLTKRIDAYVSQFATAEPVVEIHTGHNLQLTPHMFVNAEKFLDQSADNTFSSSSERVGGLDAKWVLSKGMTLDLTANPDFSQVESDEPQVTVNRRYEVYFPEKRPFFMESASFFQTPEELFFSRRIVDPQFGARLTGKVEGLTIGALSIDDREHEQTTSEQQPPSKRAHVGVIRVQSDIGKESTIGTFLSQYSNGPVNSRTLAIDTRLKLNPNWIATAQAVRTSDKGLSGPETTGRNYLVELEHVGRHFNLDTSYSDLSPHFHPQLGFIPRVDLKQIYERAGYQWHPDASPVVGFGPALTVLADWDHAGQLQDWQFNLPFTLQLKRSTSIAVGRQEVFERYQTLPFREHATYATLSTEVLNCLSLDLSYVHGTNINYYPAQGLSPSLMRSNDAGVGIVLRPTSRIRIAENYLFDQLHEESPVASGAPSRSVLNNHVFSTRISMQFTRALSLRTIIDYNGIIANGSIINLERNRVLSTDTLLTYMLSPGTAIYAGYADQFENLALHGDFTERTNGPTLQTGRQAFLKVSYTFRP